MALDLCDYETRARDAVLHFWRTRDKAVEDQKARGRVDQGPRGSATAGRHMDAFAQLFVDIAKAHGLPSTAIFTRGRELTLPGFFRPSKNWDLIVMNEGRLVAALDFKVAVDLPNPYACISEAISDAVDFNAQQRRAWQHMARPPFIGFLFMTPTALLDEFDTRCGDLIQQRICDRAAALGEHAPHAPRFGELISNFAARCAVAATPHTLRAANTAPCI